MVTVVLYGDDVSPEKGVYLDPRRPRDDVTPDRDALDLSEVYVPATGKTVNTPKAYAKSMKPAGVPESIVRFFSFGVAPSSRTRAALAHVHTRIVGGHL
ncbi:hypothetical protein LXA43DRAFT_422808 [Ganoderma leucocontextum]|nr:hypothetical protein LXA43DRAFT_422808 [Ganoderma leucocontextum]